VFETSTFSLNDEKFSERNVLIMVKDITNIRINDQRLLQDSKMLAMGVLATGVAHEIRNPLGLIENYTYILRTNTKNDPARTEKALTVIENSVERASKIIDNLLNFSRISSNECVPTKMKIFISDILELEHKSLSKRNVTYKVKCDEKLVCCTKHESLKHIFVNLISNAADAMKDGGLIDIYCYTEDSNLKILFRDNGSGIERSDLENIFTPFFTTKNQGKGTGLGLYIVYNEVLKSGGVINVNSKIGIGTTFDILIPLGKGADDEYKTQII
jgi:polar amino acid transport system substrate-binding protein